MTSRMPDLKSVALPALKTLVRIAVSSASRVRR
jgi:hypothetical protein